LANDKAFAPNAFFGKIYHRGLIVYKLMLALLGELGGFQRLATRFQF